MKFEKHCIILSQAIFLLAVLSSFSIAQDLEGAYTTVGRRCEDSKLFVPIEGSIEEMVFRGGLFQHVTTTTDEGEMTTEEYIEEKRTTARKRYDDTVESHERACRDGEEIFDDNYGNICEKEGKEQIYDQWWDDIMNPVEQEIEEIEEERSGSGICQMTLTGNWSVRGEILTIQQTSFNSTSACGNQTSSGFRSVTVNYYFEDNFLYLSQPANEQSREFCGDSDWAEIYLKK